VRFQNDQQVFNAVKQSVLSVVRQMSPTIQLSQVESPALVANATSSQIASYAQLTEQKLVEFSVAEKNLATSFNFVSRHGDQALSHPASPNAALPNDAPETLLFSELKYIGQLFECYLLCELGNKLVIVDMHAAHERVNFNLLRNRFHSNGVPSQQLLVPITVNLSGEGFAAITEQLDKLERFGFKIEAFGDTAVLIRAAPTIVSSGAIESLIKELASDDLGYSSALEEQIDHVSARIACHASIRSGRILERAEVYALFAALDSADCSSACPHGRPIVVNFSEREVEHWFGRDR
jgi:DNA mismatch repair protein MutL